MRYGILGNALLLAAATPTLAQMPAPPPRTKGPALALAVEAAQLAIKTCLANGYKTSALVVDAGGVTVALLTSEGAVSIAPDFAYRKVAAVLRYKIASDMLVERVKTNAALAEEVKADPKIGFAMPGALPLMAGGEMIGALAVSGAPGGDKDLACAKPAVAKIAGRLK